jgi:hypothetical protein
MLDPQSGGNQALQVPVEIFVEAVRFPTNADQIYNREMENLRFLAWLVFIVFISHQERFFIRFYTRFYTAKII